ncbi:MAG: ParA family protein [Desulfamplus sp.]|nr:ParA family protein [Desulfamplus sp.]MBF0411129.1 ParA family protein [Desulfamplus sp.]
MKVISFANQKGGCGKSTIVINLALNFALQKKRVILFDTDPQKSSYETLDIREDKLFKVVAVYSDIYQTLEKYEPYYDYAMIDTPPHDNEIVTVSVVCSDLVIIPVQDSPLDIRSTKVTVDLIRKAKTLNPDLKCYFLLSRIQPQTVLAKELAEILTNLYETDILNTQISNRVSYKYSLIYGKSVTEMFNSDAAATEINDLSNEILNILKS